VIVALSQYQIFKQTHLSFSKTILKKNYLIFKVSLKIYYFSVIKTGAFRSEWTKIRSLWRRNDGERGNWFYVF